MASGSSRRSPSCGSTPPSRPKRPGTPRRVPAIDALALPARGATRTCVGCRTRRLAVDLVRLTRRAPTDGARRVDADGASDGRGAWLCRDEPGRCLDDAIRTKRIDRAWRASLDASDHDEIRRALRPLMTTAVRNTAHETPDGADAVAVGMTTGKG